MKLYKNILIFLLLFPVSVYGIGYNQGITSQVIGGAGGGGGGGSDTGTTTLSLEDSGTLDGAPGNINFQTDGSISSQKLGSGASVTYILRGAVYSDTATQTQVIYSDTASTTLSADDGTSHQGNINFQGGNNVTITVLGSGASVTYKLDSPAGGGSGGGSDTGTTTISLDDGTPEQAPGNVNFQGGTNITITRIGSGASVTAIINSTGGGGSGGNQYLVFGSFAPSPEPGGAVVDGITQYVTFLGSRTTQMDFGSARVPSNWNGSSNFEMTLGFSMSFPTAGTATFQMLAQNPIKDGDNFDFNDWDFVGSFSVNLASQTGVQVFNISEIVFPLASATKGDKVYWALKRFPGNSSDTLPDLGVSISDGYWRFNGE